VWIRRSSPLIEMTEYNISYTPQNIVEQMHQVPHLTGSLKATDNTFGITYDSTSNDYTKSLLPLPLLCMALALLAVIIFQCATCFAGCCCQRAVPDDEIRKKRLRNYGILFLLAFVAVLLFDQTLIFGSKYLGEGVDTADGGLDYVGDTFSTLKTYGADLTADGQDIQTDFTNSANINNCNEANTLNSYMDDYFTYVDDYNQQIQDIPNKVNDAQDALHKYGVDYKNKTVWVFYAMFIVCIVVYAIGMVLKQRVAVFVGMACSDLVMIFVFIICGVVMIILVSDTHQNSTRFSEFPCVLYCEI
jgi:hypothetical protein